MARIQRTRPRGSRRSAHAVARTSEVCRHRCRQPRRVLHGPGGRSQDAISDDDASVDLPGLTPQQQLTAVARRSHDFVAALYDLTTHELLPALAKHKIRVVSLEELGDARAASLGPLPRHGVAGPDAARDRQGAAVSASGLAQPESYRRPGAAPGGSREPRSPSFRFRQLTRLVQIPKSGHTFVLLEEIIRAHLAASLPRTAHSRVESHSSRARRRAGTG